jgi:Ca-activated chloride channel family protein
MSFAWPSALFALLLVPLLVVVFARVNARRAARRADLGTMGELRTRTGRPAGRRRGVAAAFFLLGITVLIVGLARPQTTVKLPRRTGTVILAFDASNSMIAKDMKPTRIAAAQRAALGFVKAQPTTIRIGVVSFNDTGYVLQEPTRSRHDVEAAIRRITTGGGTSVGDAILTSLAAIHGKALKIDPQALQDGAQQQGIPFLGSSAVVLLTDGENTSQLDPIVAADVAAQAGVRVNPIGIGSASGTVVTIDGFSVATHLDEPLLRKVARATNGTYYRAKEAAALANVYRNIDLRLTFHGAHTEVTALFAAGGALLILIGTFLSLRWFGRVM